MTNPPFGGEEERGILSNFPEDKQTAETALLFLQLIMRKLRRPLAGHAAGRCGVVVPNGFLSGDGIAARIKEELLSDFNLHTIVRLPNGVFSPYTPIPTNILFFDRSKPTNEIWYYEHPLPEGKKQYTKTAPLQISEFSPCLTWWKDREENRQAWRVTPNQVRSDAFNLDILNPRRPRGVEELPPEQLIDSLIQKETRVLELLVHGPQYLSRPGVPHLGGALGTPGRQPPPVRTPGHTRNSASVAP